MTEIKAEVKLSPFAQAFSGNCMLLLAVYEILYLFTILTGHHEAPNRIRPHSILVCVKLSSNAA